MPSGKKRKQTPPYSNYRNTTPNTAGAIRDVFCHAISKGQLPILIVGAIILVSLWRLPAKDLTTFWTEVFRLVEKGYLIGYILFVGTIIAWHFHSKWQRRTMGNELHRVADERTALQQKLVPEIKSSKEGQL